MGGGHICANYWGGGHSPPTVPPYSYGPVVMYLACETFMENHLTTLDSTFFLKLMPENQDQSGRLTVYVQIPLPQDVFTNQIWD